MAQKMNMISAHHNYDFGYIGLVNIELGNLPQKISVGEYELSIKSEFHISIICAKKIAALIDKDRASEIEAQIVEIFLQFIRRNSLSKYEITTQYRLAKRGHRVTLIVMTVIPGIEDFFTELERKYDTKLPLQPTHITLYTLQPDAGIGILSPQELKHDTATVDVVSPLLSTSVSR